MNSFAVYWAEFRHEIRAGLRGPLFPITAIGFTLYILLLLINADTMRDMGASDIPRNSAVLVYRLSTGMSMFLFFVWAWVFGQAVVRDRNVHLDENVLCSPIRLHTLLFARYLGATVVGFLLGAVVPLSLFLTPMLAWLGLVPQASVGAAPVLPVLMSLLLFVLPTTLGLGALFICSALWTRSTAGPFAVAAALMLIWMFGLVVLRGGDISDTLSVLVDPSVFVEFARQTEDWTPSEKAGRLMDVTPVFLINRLLWCLLPVGLMLVMLRRFQREHLLLDNSKKTVRDSAVRQTFSATEAPAPVIVSGKPSWLRAMLCEALWHLRLSFQNWGMLLVLGVFLLMGVSVTIMHLMRHGDGPIAAHVGFLMPFLGDFFYLYSLFAVAGFVGTLMRRDQRTGFEEMFDATPAPLGTRVMARLLAAFFLTMTLALSPALTAWIVMAIGGPVISWGDTLVFQVLVIMPAMLEICALTVLSHSLIRSTGAAYGVSMMFVFIAIVNHVLELVSYPPAQIGMPMHLSLSSISGWQPWLSSLISIDLLKLGVVAVVAALAWLSWQRGVDSGFAQRWWMACSRTRGAAPLAIAGLLLIAIPGVLLYQKLVNYGEYQSLEAKLAEDAAWEQRWWGKGNAYSLQGGEVHIQVNPSERKLVAQWTLNNIQTAEGFLHGSLPHGVDISAAVVAGREVVPDTAYDHFSLPLDSCPAQGCNVQLTLTAQLHDWPDHGVQPWLHPSGVWLRAGDVLPTLGFDPERRLRVPAERMLFSLPELADNLPRHALQTAKAVAPAGPWRWSVVIDAEGVSTQTSGLLIGPLDFAMVWLPGAPEQATQNGIQAWHGHEYRQAAKDILEDLQLMAQCVGDLLGQVPDVSYVVQAPRELGEIALHGELLWLPENLGWDIAGKGPGRQRRRAAIASALARHILLQAADLRAEPGAEWLLSGVAGWVGMECLRRSDGQQAWIDQQTWQTDQLSEALSELEAPVRRVVDAGEANWIEPYTTLSTLNWAAGQGAEKTAALIKKLLKRLQNNEPLPEALAALAGQQTADRLLGMPLAADVALSVDDKQQVHVSAQRWQWHNNGWQMIEPPRVVLQLAAQNRQLFDLQKSVAISIAQDFVVLDSWPSVERTPKDNVWRHVAKP